MTEHRRDKRFAAHIVAKFVRRGETVELLTSDVSFRGAFLRTDSPPELRQLVKVAFALPSGEIVAGHAMVVHVEPPGSSAVPGVGVQFWGTMDHAKNWEQFIHEVQDKGGDALDADIADKVRRQSERFKLAIDVQLDGKTAVTRDLSETGMAVRTDLELLPGMRAAVRMHAGSGAIEVDVIVRRQIVERAFKGLGVEFANPTGETRRRILAFLERNAPKDDAVFVAPDDPELH